MRLLIANDSVQQGGGVDTYLRAIVRALGRRGHAIAWLHYDRRTPETPPVAEPAFGVLDRGLDDVLHRVAAWAPDVCYSHNMRSLEVDAALAARWPVVRMMHGYFGTCISGQKAHLLPSAVPCAKPFTAACTLRYFPRRCGEANPLKLWRQYAWARKQQEQFLAYSAIVVASDHMRHEYIANGAPARRVHALPLFAPATVLPRPMAAAEDRVLFLGRMTALKGGDVLVRACTAASKMLRRTVALTMAGEGPARSRWERIAKRESVRAQFVGWVGDARRDELLDASTVLAVPSTWPEPFGLVGLEAAARGVPSVGFEVGGIREWLHDGVNGVLAGSVPEPQALGAAIARVLGDPALRARLAAGALETARAMTVDRHVEALVARVLEPAARHAAAV